jgi:adenylylsulfate kinase-like enzyme
MSAWEKIMELVSPVRRVRAERHEAEARAADVEVHVSIPLREMRRNDHLTEAVRDEMRHALGDDK